MKTVDRRIVDLSPLKSWRFPMLQVLISSVLFFSTACFTDEEILRVVFEGTISEHKWALKDLDPELPSDWSPYEYLVMELRASSPQRFFLRTYTADGIRRLVIMPVGQGVWFRASVPLQYFKGKDQEGHDLASTNNRPRNSFWMSVWGPFGGLDAVEALGVTMEYPLGKPTLEIRSIRLAKEDPGSDILEKLPVVGEFGQWIPTEWPGKIRNLEQLEQEWAEEAEKLGDGDFNHCRYGGYLGTQAEATGFFRVEQIEGKWWFVDPDGHLFLSTGVNCMGNSINTRTEGRESYYAALPPPDPMRSTQSRGRGSSVSFYTWNLQRRFGEGWNTKWIDQLIKRMESWGLNTVANWSSSVLRDTPRKPYVAGLSGWQRGGTSFLGLPDVFSDEFALSVDEAVARQCEPRKNDPWLSGYFIGNEPPWPGRESELVGMILAGPETTTQRELKAFLAQGDTPERHKEFILSAFERYLNLISTAIRKHDPNHLNLGIRFGGHPADEVIRMGRFFEVNTLNVYDDDPVAQMERAYKLTGRPTLIGEFHIGSPGNGLAAGLVQARDQEERGVAYRYYVEQAAALPSFLGVHWFQWLDQPVTGRGDGENYNIGFVDVTDRPHWDFVEGVKATNQRLFDVHSGKEPPVNRKAKVQ